jgi:hypothetical protein
VIVQEHIDSITIDGTLVPIDSGDDSTVTGFGEHALSYGNNTFYVTVTSGGTNPGIDRTYTIHVLRLTSEHSFIDELTVTSHPDDILQPLTPTFSPDHNVYEVTVPIGTTSVTIFAESDDNNSGSMDDAFIIGDGEHTITPGLNVIVVTIVSPGGEVNTYTINITRPSDDNTNLASLVPSVGELTPDYDDDIDEYMIFLAGDIDTITFAVEAESAYATVIGGEETTLTTGANDIAITIIAEDGTIRIINITVIMAETTIITTAYTINRDLPDLDPSDPSYIDHAYVIGMEDQLRISDFITQFDNDEEYLRVYDSLGNRITNENTFIGTGMVLKLDIRDTVYDWLYIVVRGDINGDGIIDSVDIGLMADFIGRFSVQTGVYLVAMDLVDNNIDSSTTFILIDSEDYSMLCDYVGRFIGGLN